MRQVQRGTHHKNYHFQKNLVKLVDKEKLEKFNLSTISFISVDVRTFSQERFLSYQSIFFLNQVFHFSLQRVVLDRGR